MPLLNEKLSGDPLGNGNLKCNLCSGSFASSSKLQEHLIEHTFVGCQERGFICYLCSSVFTTSSGLQNHIPDHGIAAKPYDCHLCDQKFFFRSELDHHLIGHAQNDDTIDKDTDKNVVVDKEEVESEQQIKVEIPENQDSHSEIEDEEAPSNGGGTEDDSLGQDEERDNEKPEFSSSIDIKE